MRRKVRHFLEVAARQAGHGIDVAGEPGTQAHEQVVHLRNVFVGHQQVHVLAARDDRQQSRTSAAPRSGPAAQPARGKNPRRYNASPRSGARGHPAGSGRARRPLPGASRFSRRIRGPLHRRSIGRTRSVPGDHCYNHGSNGVPNEEARYRHHHRSRGPHRLRARLSRRLRPDARHRPAGQPAPARDHARAAGARRRRHGIVRLRIPDAQSPGRHRRRAHRVPRLRLRDAGRRAAARTRHGAQGPAAGERPDLLGAGQGHQRDREPRASTCWWSAIPRTRTR